MKKRAKIDNYSVSLFLGAVAIVVFVYSGVKINSLVHGKPQVKGISTTAKVTGTAQQDSSNDDSDPATPSPLATKSGMGNQSATEAAILQRLDYLQSEIDAINNEPTTTSSSSADVVPYVYKIVNQIDSCTLNKLSKQGWHIYQMGTIVNAAGGTTVGGSLDENCKPSPVNFLDWAVLQKP